MLTPDRDHHAVRVLASLSDAALIASGVLDAELICTTAVVVVPAAVREAVICGLKREATRSGNRGEVSNKCYEDC